MKKIYSALTVLIIVLSNGLYSQCSLYPVSLSSRVNNSTLIIEGKVISKQSFWNTSRNYIYTSNVVSVNQIIKGALQTSFVEIITEGGQIDLNKQTVDPSLQLKINDQGVFTLNSFSQPSQSGYPVFQAYSDQQGFIKFNLSNNSAADPFNNYTDINTDLYGQLKQLLGTTLTPFSHAAHRFDNSNSISSVTGFSPSHVSAGTSSTLTINGVGFGTVQSTSYVEFANADDGGSTFIQPDPSQYLSWSDTQIKVLVPSGGGSGGTAGTGSVGVTVAGNTTLSAQTLTVDFAEINVSSSGAIYNTRHVALNGNGGITWQMYTAFDANALAKASFLRAFQTWRCGTTINWVLGSTVSTNTIALDGVNVIRFDIGSELPNGVLGRCSSYFGGCYIGPNVFFYVSELDICFDDAVAWQYGPALPSFSEYDFESVAVHELGHGHQLTHVIDANDFMHYALANGQSKRALITNDLTGGNDVMTRNFSGGVCTYSTMTAINSSVCASSAVTPTAAFVLTSSVCVNQSVALNSTSTGTPTSWQWTITGGNPSTSTLQNTSTVYSSAGIYTVSLIASNSSGSSSAVSHTINVINLPNISVSSSNICSGNTGTLTASGPGSFVWSPGGATGATQTFSPSGTQIYTVTENNGVCTNTAIGTLSVTPSPVISIPSTTVCDGSSAVITASGASSFTWNPGLLTGATQTLTAASSSNIYTVTGSNGSCTDSIIYTLNVSASPTVSGVASSTILCSGQTITLTASGANTFTFEPGTIVLNPAIVTPTASTHYTVTGEANGCTETAIIKVVVVVCTGIENITSKLNFKAFPNPTENLITLIFEENFSGKVRLFNSLGQLVINQTSNNAGKLDLDLTGYAKGIYLAKLVTVDGNESYIKIVKQ